MFEHLRFLLFRERFMCSFVRTKNPFDDLLCHIYNQKKQWDTFV